MATFTITLPSNVKITNGKQITFRAPSDCKGVTGIIINNKTYNLVDAANKSISDINSYINGAMLSVVLDADNQRAYLQNGISSTISSANSSSKLFLIGATQQSNQNDATYSHDTAYVGTDGCLYSGGQKTLTLHSTANTNGYFYTGTTAPTGTSRLNFSGYLYATRVYNAMYNDYAELFLKDDPEEIFEAGDVIVKVRGKNTYTKCRDNNNSLVIGVVSENYGHLLGGTGNEEYDNKHYIPIGLAGVIPVKITGEFEEGDLLTSSDKEGYAEVSSYYMPGTIIGKVLQKLDDDKALMLIMNC